MKLNIKLIEKTRIIKRMTRDDVSEITGLAPFIVAKVETETDPRRFRPSTLGKIADALGLTMEQIVIEGEPDVAEVASTIDDPESNVRV
jgi:hypothetical protein